MEKPAADCASRLPSMKNRIRIAKVTVVVLALICVIMVIFILAKSSQYFGKLFSLSDEITAKAYLKEHFQAYMCLLYLSIFGFVVSLSDTVLFFYKFSQKDKIIWFQVIYFLAFFISGMVALSDKDYQARMVSLKGLSVLSSSCSGALNLFQCSLAAYYVSYRSQAVSFFVVFCISFSLFTAVYHYSVLKLLPNQIDEKDEEGKEGSKKQQILDFKKNDTFASQFDEYLN